MVACYSRTVGGRKFVANVLHTERDSSMINKENNVFKDAIGVKGLRSDGTSIYISSPETVVCLF